MKTRIYYHHTDCGGVVYYGNYLKFFEEARTQYLEDRGVSVKELADSGIIFVVYRQEVDYKYPAFYGDVLETFTKLTNMSEFRFEFEYEIKNQNGKTTTKGKTVMVSIDKNTFEPTSIPQNVKAALV